MQLKQLITKSLPTIDGDWDVWTPADYISRNAWQIAAKVLIVEIQLWFSKSDFNLSSSEISVFYHKPLGQFAELIRGKLDYRDL